MPCFARDTVDHMDEVEVEYNEYSVAAFDGRVLEIFYLGIPSNRYHVTGLAVTVKGPNKRGNYEVSFLRPSTPGAAISLDAEEFGRLQPLFDALRSAGVSVTGL
jgi:hypothetical protein